MSVLKDCQGSVEKALIIVVELLRNNQTHKSLG